MFAKAKTGSGKTLGFLLPALEAITARQMGPLDPQAVAILVLSPSRELAEQTRREAEKLLSFHEGLGAQIVMGGTDLKKEQRRLAASPCQVLVATPGRLQDHLDNTRGFAERLRATRVVVLDEADRLLDMGFLPAIKQIAQSLPPAAKRQTLLFTATVPKGVHEVSQVLMRPGFQFIDTVGEDGPSHKLIRQEYLVAPMVDVMPVRTTQAAF